jgi:hypothetical protein
MQYFAVQDVTQAPEDVRGKAGPSETVVMLDLLVKIWCGTSCIKTASNFRQTEYPDFPVFFQDPGARKVVADFSGGFLSSEGGALLLQQVYAGPGISRTWAACLRDERDPKRVEHSIEEPIRQRLFALSPGYEDLNDPFRLRHDPLLAAVIGREEPLGTRRRLEKECGSVRASPSTLHSWSCGRRMLCEAEALAGMKSNLRVVTSNITAKGISNRNGGILVGGEVEPL